MRRMLALLLTLVLALTSMASVAAQAGPSTDPADPVEGCEYFEETGHNLCGVFLAYWNANGGLPIFGYPKTEAFDEENWDSGNVYSVQYFERERLEHHTALAGTEYEVLLGRLGNEVLLMQDRYWRDFERSDPSEENYFAETGFAVPQVFLDYWSSYGLDLGDDGISFRESLALFGYPISQAEMETNSSGDTVLTQWFERARFEHHPDNAEEHQVLLGLLGNEVLGLDNGGDPGEPVEPEPEVVLNPVTDNVSQPRHISVGADGAVYVANAGMGGLNCVVLPIPDEDGDNGEGDDNGDNGTDDGDNGEGDDNGDNGDNGTDDGDNGEGDDNGDNGDNGTDDDNGAASIDQNGEDEGDNGEGDDNGNGNGNGEEEAGFEFCIGTSGSITRIADGEAETFIDGIPSVVIDGEAVGLHSVVVTEEGDVYGVIGFGLGFTPDDRAELGEGAEFFGHLVQIAEDGSLTSVADILQYEADENPDGGEIDANPYALILDGDDFIVVDAGMNALLRVTQEGVVSVLAVFAPQMVDAPPFLGLPEGTQIPSESVPTHVAVGPDGNYYVSELTGFPFPVGSARIWMVPADGEGDAEVVETGFTNIGAIAFDSEGNLLVLEIVAGGLLGVDEENPATAAGSLTRISEDGSRETLAGIAQGLIFSTGLTVDGDDTIYVANMAVIPGASHIATVEWVMPEE